jgi:hypothetical protein
MTSNHPLDRAVWNALTTVQAHLSIAEGGLLRFDSAYALFAAARAGAPDEEIDWVGLARRTGRLALFETDPVMPAGLVEVDRIDCQQMVCTALTAGGRRVDFEPLTDADGSEMLALATLTKPGPFFAKTHLLGPFIGIRDERGDTVFLHARIGHEETIAFYETLGFRRRTTPSYVVMEPAT